MKRRFMVALDEQLYSLGKRSRKLELWRKTLMKKVTKQYFHRKTVMTTRVMSVFMVSVMNFEILRKK